MKGTLKAATNSVKDLTSFPWGSDTCFTASWPSHLPRLTQSGQGVSRRPRTSSAPWELSRHQRNGAGAWNTAQAPETLRRLGLLQQQGVRTRQGWPSSFFVNKYAFLRYSIFSLFICLWAFGLFPPWEGYLRLIHLWAFLCEASGNLTFYFSSVDS